MNPVSALIGYLGGIDFIIILRDETAWCGKYIYVTGTSSRFSEREGGVLLEQEVHSKGLEEKIPIDGFDILSAPPECHWYYLK
jgi:hypothetical protein